MSRATRLGSEAAVASERAERRCGEGRAHGRATPLLRSDADLRDDGGRAAGRGAARGKGDISALAWHAGRSAPDGEGGGHRRRARGRRERCVRRRQARGRSGSAAGSAEGATRAVRGRAREVLSDLGGKRAAETSAGNERPREVRREAGGRGIESVRSDREVSVKKNFFNMTNSYGRRKSWSRGDTEM